MAQNLKDLDLKKIFLGPVKASYDQKILSLCVCPYPGHPKGCPNLGKKTNCPPKTFYFPKKYKDEVYIIVMGMDFGSYLKMRQQHHPNWSDKQLRNPLYWQGYLRKLLKEYTKETFNKIDLEGKTVLVNPEAYGINVTATCRKAGLILEWPPKKFVYKINFIVFPK